jgi:hypothetical protein
MQRWLNGCPHIFRESKARLFLDKIFAAGEVESMKRTKVKWNFILWNEAFGFSLMIVLSWLTEAMHVPHLIFGEPFTPNTGTAPSSSPSLFC